MQWNLVFAGKPIATTVPPRFVKAMADSIAFSFPDVSMTISTPAPSVNLFTSWDTSELLISIASVAPSFWRHQGAAVPYQ